MAGISKKWIWALAALSVVFSCVKEKTIEEPVDNSLERFAEYDPVVRFGLETYMGDTPSTKTTYAGETQTYVVFDEAIGKEVRYERINWNVDPTDTKNLQDVVRIFSETEFTKNNSQEVDYKAIRIPGVTNVSDIKDDRADTEPLSGEDKDRLYWSQSTEERYFYGLYPSPDVTGSTLSFNHTTDLNTDDHEVTVSGSIPSVQPYLEKKVTGRVVEYLPNMANAYMYAAAKIPSADAGYVKVPLRFKPLFSAIKLIVSANANDDGSGVGAKKYRLKRVDLRTDLFYDDLNQGDPTRVNKPENGTALNGDFTATFGIPPGGDKKKPEYTGDFIVTDYPSKADPTSLDNTNKRLTINIKDGEREWLSDVDTVKLTFLALPIEQKVMTVVYTFEVNDGSGNPKKDENGNIIEVTRYLALQTRTREEGGKVYRNEFEDKEEYWYSLPAAHKLYVKSNVPEILYYFDVQARGNFPRTWNSGDDKDADNHYYSDDFYSVQSYRDSAGVKQPLKWKVTGYMPEGESTWSKTNSADWLRLRGDDGTWDMNHVDNKTDPYNPASGVNPTGDPWSEPWGAGTPVVDGKFEKSSESHSHAWNYIKGTSFVSYTAAAENNGSARNQTKKDGKPDVFGDNRDWDTPVSYLFKDLDGKYYYQDNHTHTPSAGWAGLKDEAYAYDLSSHDIYGNLTVTKNGDVGTTANCYVVSAPGWYRFPAVYGNALKNGSPNSDAYTGAGGDGLLGAFLNHNNEGITIPEISGISSVDVLWDDTQGTAASTRHLVARHNTTSSRADRGAFYHKEPTDTYGYIYFYVDDIAQGNAVIAAYNGTTIVWSWHIWAVTKPETYLEEVALYTNLETLNPWDPIDDALAKFVINYSNYIINPPSAADVTDDLTEPRKSCVNPGTFWKMADLGQNGNESGNVEPRYCDVEFTQYFRGKEVKKVVRRFLQSGVKDQGDGSDTAPKYQWGRKDPFKVEFLELKHADPADPASYVPTERTGENIQRPTLFYYGDAKYPPTDKPYDNLWNTKVTAPVLNSYASGKAGGSQDRQVEKTIYDPSPVGYSLPNMYAYSAFNPYGAISNVKFPAPLVGEIAKNPETWSSNYVDFYAGYKDGAKYKRDKDGETIRIYFTGRIKATGKPTDTQPPGQIMSPTAAYYWTSEPAKFEGYYGRSFSIDNNFNPTTALSKSGAYWAIYPVAGGNYDYIQSGYCPKWQRTHGHAVRPMRNP